MITSKIIESHFISGGIRNVAEQGFGRFRPFEGEGPYHFDPGHGSSFPSGHAGTAAACFAALALVIGLGSSPRTKAVLSGAAVGIAAAVASSRVLLGVHWLTDVMAGLAVGWAWFAICSIAFGGRMLRFGAPIEAAERVLPADDDDPAIAQAGTARP